MVGSDVSGVVGREFAFFSVDDHIIEPADLWTSRLPASFRDVGPHVVRDGDGHDWWEFEDTRHTTFGLNAVAGKPREQWGTDPLNYEDMIPGCWDPVERAKDLR